MLRDPVFRQALNYAVDRNKIVATAFNGYALPGSSLIVPYSPYHWQPPANDMFTYDPAKANQMLDAAGYKMGSNGYRTTKQGKPLTLRLMVTTDSPANVVAGKLAVQWFKNVGVKVTLSVVDPGVLTSAQYQFSGNTYTPNWDMFMWYWTQDVDPAFMVSIYTPAQSDGYGWNDCLWTDPAYTKLSNEAADDDRPVRSASPSCSRPKRSSTTPRHTWSWPTPTSSRPGTPTSGRAGPRRRRRPVRRSTTTTTSTPTRASR